MRKDFFRSCLFGIITSLCFYSRGEAQETLESAYPLASVRLIVPFPKDGPTDRLARVLSKKMSEILGQPFEIVNPDDCKKIASSHACEWRSKADTNPQGKKQEAQGATKLVLAAAMAKPDGYTLVVGNQGTHASAPQLYGTSLRYDPEKDFIPIGHIGSTPLYVVMRKGLVDEQYNAITTFYELVNYLRRSPSDTLIIGHSGKGSTSYLAALYLMSLTKTQMKTIAYKGSSAALKDLTIGLFDVMCDQSASVIQFIKNGSVTPILYAQPVRSAVTPEVLSAKDVGLSEFNVEGWNILFAPRGTPAFIVKRLNQALNQALQDSDVLEQMKTLNATSFPEQLNTLEPLKKFIHKELMRWSFIISATHAKIDEEEDITTIEDLNSQSSTGNLIKESPF